MKDCIFNKICIIFAAFSILLISGGTVTAQEILLDKMEKCGDLICYPSMKEPNEFYYLPDQPRLAYKHGKPQFSFLKYARTRATGKAGTGTAQGGGILHFLVTYGATKDRVRAAEKELQERHPDAKIVSPIVYRRGSFALITSFKEGDVINTRTVAVGKAPLMEGQKAAVSMALTRQGAELLWESFKSDTPDISLVFDMEFAGIRNPFEAKVEADWSRISSSQSIKAGVKYAWFGADVDMLFQELRQTQAVKVTTKGENAPLERILQAVNAKLLNVMFDPAPAPELTRAAAENSYSNLNQAVKMLKGAAQSRSSSRTRSPGTSRRTSMVRPYSHGTGSAIYAAMMDLLGAMAYADPPVQDAQTDTDSDTQSDMSERLAPARQRYAEANELYDAGRFQDAIQAYEEAEEMGRQATGADSPNGSIPFNIGQCHMELGNYEQAIPFFEDAMQRYGEGSDGAEDARQALEEARQLAARGGDGGATGDAGQQHTDDAPALSAADAYNQARRLYEDARTGGFQSSATQAALQAYESYQQDYSPTGSRADEVSGRIRMLQQRLEDSGVAPGSSASAGSGTAGSSAGLLPNPFDIEDSSSSPAGSSGAAVSSGSRSSGSSGSAARPSSGASASTRRSTGARGSGSSSPARRQTGSAASQRANGGPGFSLVASYRLRKLKSSGKMVYEMNHYSNETQAFAMAENIGAIYKKYGNDPSVFRAVTIDDPVFKQREIMVTLDGQDMATFHRYVNFVTVKMKKRHQAGEVTTGEIVITPETFNNAGNKFSMTYGWKNDSNRTAWLNYEYQVTWSFHGGIEIRQPWTKTDSPMLALAPPHRYRLVSIEGDGGVLTDAEVRHGVVTFSCRIGDRYIPQQVTIKNNSPAPTMMLEIPEDQDNPDTSVDITWYLTKSRKLSSAQTKLEGDIIYWDELPKGGV